MADAARFRDANESIANMTDGTTSATTAKILASRAIRRQSNAAALQPQPQSSSLVAIQQRKLQENAEQLLQTQLAELRNIVADDQVSFFTELKICFLISFSFYENFIFLK